MLKKSLFLLLFYFIVPSLHGATWNQDISGPWETATNWDTGTVPNSMTATAVFGNAITADRTVSINTPNQIQSLTFDSAFSYTLSATGGSLTVGDTITLTSGSHNIDTNMTFGPTMTINQNSTQNSFFTGDLSGSTLRIQGTGGATQTVFSGFLNMATAINVDTTTMVLEPGSSVNAVPISLGNTGIIIVRREMTLGNDIIVTAGDGVLNVTEGNTLTLNGALTSTGGTDLTFSGPGMFVVPTANTITARINTVEGAIVTIGDDASFGTAPVIMSASSTLTNTATRTLANTIEVLDAAIITAAANTDITLNGAISGAGGLTLNGPGTKILNTANAITGGVTLTEGVTRLGDDAGFGVPASAVSLSGGTLEITANRTVANPIAVNAPSTIDVAAGTGISLNGAVSGTEALSFTGEGAKTFGVANGSYSGPITITAGTVIAIDDVSFGTGDVTLSGATLTTNAANHTFANNFAIEGTSQIVPLAGTTLILNGVLSGAGNITVPPSASVLSLSGDNKLSGTLLFQNDNLTISNGNAFGTATVTFAGTGLSTNDSLSVPNNLVLSQDTGINPQTNDLALLGNISGAGGLNVLGAAGTAQTLTLGGNNNYEGTTTLTDLNTTIFTDAGLGGGDLILNSSVLNADGTFSSTRNINLNTTTGTEKSGIAVTTGNVFTTTGTLTGTDGFIKSGKGYFVLPTDQSALSGIISVTEGTLTIDGALANANLEGSGSAIIGGNGSAQDVTMNDGLLKGNATYASITMNSGIIAPGNSIGTITVTGNYVQNAGSIYVVEIEGSGSDQIIVNGNATIQNGAILTISEPVGTIIEGTTYDILTATAIDQPWSVVNLPNGALFSLELVEGNTIARLTALSSIAFLNQAIDSGNPITIANYINALDIGSNSDLITIITAIDSDTNNINQSLNQLHHARFGAFEITNVESNFNIISTIDHHNSSFGCVRDCRSNNPHGIWVGMLGGTTSRKLRGQLRGSDNKDIGAILGYDYSLQQNVVLGVSGGYLNTDLDWDERGGSATVQKGFGAIYGSYNDQRFEAILCLMAGGNFYDIDRRIAFANIDRTATSNNTGGFFTSNIGGKVDLLGTPNTVIAQANIGYHYLSQGSFEETGANSINLAFDSRTSHFLRSQLGLQLSGKTQMHQNCFRYYVGGNWVNKSLLSDDEFSGKFLAFQDDSKSFTVASNDKGINGFLAEAGIEVSTNRNRFILGYEGEFAQKDHNHRVQGSVGFYF